MRVHPGEPGTLIPPGQDQRAGDVDGDLAGRLDRVAGAAVYEPQLRGQVAARHPPAEPATPPATSPNRTKAAPDLAAPPLPGAADVTASARLRAVAGNAALADGGGLPAAALACLAKGSAC